MTDEMIKTHTQMFLSGSEAAAWGAKLARVQVVSAYPITPNTATIAAVAELINEGIMDAEFVNAEGEHSACSIVAGASSAGVRSFTASCGQGIAYMHEVMWMASGMALPFVMAVTTRGIGSPQTFGPDTSDVLSERDSSWLQFHCEDAQEILDSMIMAYRVSEHEEVLLPSLVSYEGFRLTHTYEPVMVPDQELADRFLPPYTPKHAFLDPDYPIQQGHGSLLDYSNMKRQQHEAMLRAKGVIKEVCREFEEVFGRKYGLIEEYMAEDADLVVVTYGTAAGVVKDVVDEYRKEGEKVGLVRIRVYRPFPEEELRSTLADKKKILVLDRFRSPGSHGIFFMELRNALYGEKPRISNFVLGHEDVFSHDIKKMIEQAKREDQFDKWYNVGMPEAKLKVAGEDNYQRLRRGEKFVREDVKEGPLVVPGTNICQGCASMLAVRHVIETVGKNCVVPIATGCIMAAMGVWPLSSYKFAGGHYCFTNVASIASGIEAAKKRQGKDYTVLAIGGDGGLGDIGFGALSGAVERGHKIVYICYDNEAYMTTGVQRSGTTPYLAKTKTTPWGKNMKKKDLARIIEANGAVYVATASPSYLPDLRKKVLKAKEANGPAFIHILCPCPTGWEMDPALAIEIGRLAVETGSWILYEWEGGKRTITKVPKKRRPVEEYLKLQGRFSYITDAQMEEIQRDVDKRWQELVEGQ